jgi:PAS domain S-box-containing protein
LNRASRLWQALSPVGRARRSVRGKVMGVVLLTTAIALLVAGSAMLTRDLGVYRQSWASDLATQASILASSTRPALEFDDHDAAERALSSLQARPEVLLAALYSANGDLYAQYSRSSTDRAPPRVPSGIGFSIAGERVEVTSSLVRNHELLGTLYLRARYDVMGRIKAYFEIFAIVIALSMSVAVVLSSTLQHIITAPLASMAAVARQMVERRDYSLRAQKTSDDEIGLLVDAFNSMLDEMQWRTQALERSNSAMREEVATRQTAEAALGHANARIESTMAAAEIGTWVWDLRSNEFSADRNLAGLLGVGDEKQISGEPRLWQRYIHPDDLPSVAAAESAAVRTGVLRYTEFRIVRANGVVRWMAGRGRAQLDDSNVSIMLSGLLIDITPQKLAEQALRESERLYRAIGESIDFGVWVCGADGRNIYASESFLRLTGITQEQCSNFGWAKSLRPEDLQATMQAWTDCIQSGAPWYRENLILGADGHCHPVLAQGVAIRGDNGEITGWAGINLDISRLKQTEDALREADRRKDEFLATLAHELRNPLAPIQHAVKILDTAASDAQQRVWAREVIARQTQRMALLLDDLLDVSRITSGRLDLKKEYLNLDSLVATAIETARPLIENKRHKLEVQLPPEPMELEVDPLRLSQALSNLLTNAAKYTDAGGHITLIVSVGGDELRMTVRDNGIGLNPQAMPQLFEMFSQVQSAIDRAEGGLGIGLALVKGLVALHGGTVEAHSAGLGRGSEFTIRLPKSVVSARASSAAGTASSAGDATGVRCRVLVADDNVDAAQTLAFVLELSGYEVFVAHSGLEALSIGARERPEVAILDIGMPEMNGYETARRIRQETWGRRALLLALTGWGQEEDKEKSKASGFDVHLTKPVDLPELETLLADFLKKRAGAAGKFAASPTDVSSSGLGSLS